jgi:CRP-like cAMP-binding protein
MVQAGVPAEGSAKRPTALRVSDAVSMLRSAPLFSALSERVMERVRGIARVQVCSSGQIVFQKGDPSDALFGVVSGRIVVSSPSPDGPAVILNLIEPGDVVGEVGFFDGGLRSADATADRETRLLVLARRDFLPLLETEPAALHRMLLLVCARLRETTCFAEDAVLLPLSVRLLHRIQALARSYGRVEACGSRVRIEHGLSQQALGDSIGASRVSVNQQLSAWRAQGLLSFGRGFTVVHDMARLESAVRGS